MALSILLVVPLAAAQVQAQAARPVGSVDPSKSSDKSVEILTPTQGVDFTYYLDKLTKEVRAKWYSAMPAAALTGERGVTRVVFQVRSNGKIEGISLDKSSGTDSLDQAALAAVRESGPLDPLPLAFKGPFIALRFVFIYNLPPDTVLDSSEPDCGISSNSKASAPPFDR
ncbi:MAG TPA: energy transducer TonB, partial [Candidatus Acidoferrum sp.]|nr:energy transducer TonB [Candidatus Acidoferrum sp.]